MTYVAVIRVVFTPDVNTPQSAQSEANRVCVAIVENPIDADKIADAVFDHVEKV